MYPLSMHVFYSMIQYVCRQVGVYIDMWRMWLTIDFSAVFIPSNQARALERADEAKSDQQLESLYHCLGSERDLGGRIIRTKSGSSRHSPAFLGVNWLVILVVCSTIPKLAA